MLIDMVCVHLLIVQEYLGLTRNHAVGDFKRISRTQCLLYQRQRRRMKRQKSVSQRRLSLLYHEVEEEETDAMDLTEWKRGAVEEELVHDITNKPWTRLKVHWSCHSFSQTS